MNLSKFILRVLGNLFVLAGLSIAIFTYVPILYEELQYLLLGPFEENYVVLDEIGEPDTKTEEINQPESENIVQIEPANQEFAVLIPKIGVNAPVVENVTTVNESEYMEALKYGVAHARGTSLPGEPGNIFLFAHSSLNFWQLGPYATVFNLLNKLEENDTVTLVYNGERYVYRVFDQDVVEGWNTEPFEKEYDQSVVTLITCDPPGTTINRRVIRAKLIHKVSAGNDVTHYASK